MARLLKVTWILFIIAGFSLHAESEGYQEWQKRRDALKQDKSVARYYTFEGVADSKSIVKDLSGNGGDLKFVPYTERATKKVFDDLQVVEGRWPEKKAVRLDRGFYQGPTFNIEKRKFTAEVWFRRQGPGSILAASKNRDGHIMSASGYREGWRIATAYDPVSAIIYALGGEGGSSKVGASIRANAAMPDNMWQHIAATWDGTEMKLYLNGKQIAANRFEKEYTPVERQNFFKLGFAEMGLGSIITDIDEVVIYNRVLAAEEIEKLGKGPEGVSEKVIFEKADSFIKKGDYRSARSEYEKLKHLPNYGKELALFNIAESYRMAKDYAGAHRTYNEIMKIDKLTAYYRIYALFRQADVYLEQKDYNSARRLYGEIIETEGALKHHIFKAKLAVGDTCKAEKKYSRAGDIYKKLLIEEESASFPNDGYRLDVRNRLEEIEGLADGAEAKNTRQKRAEWVNMPKSALYVSLHGSDSNAGTKEKPFATIERVREEIRKIKAKGMPAGGIVVYLRGGNYFLTDGIDFGKDDSGTENSPVVYRSYPGEQVRMIGGRQVTNFQLLEDPEILKRMPDEAKGRVWVADLKQAGITEYGQLLNRGFGIARKGALELICDGKIMQLARWPNEGWVRVAGLSKVDGVSRDAEFQEGKFVYSDSRPERWKGEKDMWIKGYLGVNQPYILLHARIESIDTGKKVIDLMPNMLPGARWIETRIAKNHPYFAYNLLSELDMPGEFYLDRDTGKLYFYPPGDIKKSEVIATTLDKPVFTFNEASNMVLYGLLIEGTWQHGIVINGGWNNIVAGSVIRNTGQWAVEINKGLEHKVIGCDMYGMGEGGVSLDFSPGTGLLLPGRAELIPSRHVVENNHIYRFNRFDGGYRQAVQINGIGQIVSHNVIHDTPHQLIYFNANDHIIEYNELHDGPHEGREIGAMYIYGEPWYLMSRGTVIRNNFFHHISTHSSPNLTHGLNGVHIDAMNAGLVLTKNIFYRVPNGISSTYPGNYLTNNIFIDVENRGIGQSDRSSIFCKDRDIDAGPNLAMMSRMSSQLKRVGYKQPPWNYRYPPLINMLERQPATWGSIQGSIIERNINTGGPFISFGGGVKATTHFENNWDGENPLFVNREKMDFRLRPGSPVYGLTGCEPVNFDDIGVYKDELRASWPINRTEKDIGKYYKTDWSSVGEMKATMQVLKRISPALTYTVVPRKTSIIIDGELKKEEWLNLDKSKAIVIDRYFKGEDKKGAKTYAWLQYDRDYLYVAVVNEPDPWMEGMSPRMKEHLPLFEFSIESQMGPHSRGWWLEDMPTGPIYVVWGHFGGKVEVKNNFSMPFNLVKELEDSIEYKNRVTDRENLAWEAEMKIPFGKIGINASEIDQLAFNMGTSKRGGWFAWVPTGTSVWRIENAGFIKFSR
ncbi:MAG TPA: tetratricopeptide repeat protein [bacterium]|nr:tetratricopeptide repeat protein [bacterium]